MLDPDLVTEKPPDWFWLVYDSLQLGVPIFEARTMRQIPFHWRWRIRAVKEIMREIGYERAVRSKAQGVYNFNQF